MTDFVNAWNKDSFLTYPVGPLGLIAMPGTEEIGEKVNSWLKKWQDHAEESEPGDMRTTPGVERQDFLINVTCPRFGNGEAKGMIKESIRGYDMYILCDPGAYKLSEMTMKLFMPWALPKPNSPKAVMWASLASATAMPILSRSIAAKGITPFHGRLGAFSIQPVR